MRPTNTVAALVIIPIGAVCLHTYAAQASPAFQCHKTIRPKSLQVGVRAQYDVKDGLETTQYYGFLKRRKATAKRGCFVPLKAGQCAVMRFDIDKHKSASLRGQCVIVETGKKFNRARPKRRGPFRGSDILTKCPNKTGYKCDAGHNSARANKYEKALKKKGKMLWSYCAPTAYNDRDRYIGKKVFCQMLDRKTNTVIFATEFTYAK